MRFPKQLLVPCLVAALGFGPPARAQPRPEPPRGRAPAGARSAAKDAGASRVRSDSPRLPSRAALRPEAAASPAPAVGSTDQGGLPGEKEFNQCAKLPPTQKIKFNFKPDTEISEMIHAISGMTCTKFLIPGNVPVQNKKVTVISPEPITVGDAYRLFLAALESVQLTVEPSGKFLRIIETNRAKSTTMPIYEAGEALPADRRFVTKIIPLRYLDANILNNSLLQRVKSEVGDIVPYRDTLIVTDSAENVRRLEQLIKEFDVPAANPAERVWMVRIKNMSAVDMAQRLAEIIPVEQVATGAARRGAPAMAAPPPAGAPPAAGVRWPLPGDLITEMTVTKIVPDERSNSLFMLARERGYEWAMTIIRILDQPIGEGGDGKVHVYYCEHANCDELAATLSAVVGVQVSGAGGARRTRGLQANQPQIPFAPTPVPGMPGQGQAGPLMFEGDVRITFDPPTNSLLVVSSLKDFQSLRKVIEKLDAPRKQVFIEALILEVLLDKSRDIGVAYHGGKSVDLPGGEKGLFVGGFEASKTLSPTALIGDLGGLTGALFGPTIPAQQLQVLGTTVQLPSFGVFLKLLQTNNDVNVLSNPHLLITNNQEGEISVGENLPFPGQLFGGLGGGLPGQQAGLGGFGLGTSVQRQDVALRMRLTPSVNEHNLIRIDVDQEISDVSAPNYNGLGPATSKRTAKTSIVARDQQTVVIGGLMTDRMSETQRKIPILGDIPVLGFFFRSTSKTMKKSNIIIALTPYVINDLTDLRRVAEKKLRERREFIERYSALEDKAQFDANIDYRRKRGMLEEINRTAREIEDEEAELRRIRTRDQLVESTPIEPPRSSTLRPSRFSIPPPPAPLPADPSPAPATAPTPPVAPPPQPAADPAAGQAPANPAVAPTPSQPPAPAPP